MDVFKSFTPTDIDILPLLQDHVYDCEKFRIWKIGEPGLEGCRLLFDPTPPTYSGSLWVSSAPTLAILSRLHRDGYLGQAKIINHRRTRGKYYGTRGVYSKKFYLQCVLFLNDSLLKRYADSVRFK